MEPSISAAKIPGLARGGPFSPLADAAAKAPHKTSAKLDTQLRLLLLSTHLRAAHFLTAVPKWNGKRGPGTAFIH